MRPAKAGDVLTVDYKVLVEGNEKPDLGVTARRMELGAGQLIEAFDKGLLGLSPGETKSITVRYPDDFPRQELRGVEAQVEVSVKELSEKRLPALDDEFAKDLSHESLEKLKSGVREKLETEARERAESATRSQLLEKLVAKNPIPVPPTLVEQQEKALLNDLLRFQQMFGNQSPVTEELKSSMREQAEQKVRAAFLLNKIALDQKIDVTEEEMDKKLEEMAESRGVHPAKMRANYTDKMKENLHAQLLEEKLVAYLLTQATVKETVKTVESGSQQSGK
jgi:trigger factor